MLGAGYLGCLGKLGSNLRHCLGEATLALASAGISGWIDDRTCWSGH